MALPFGFAEQMPHGGVGPVGMIRFDAALFCNSVRGAKTHSGDVLGQQVGLIVNDGGGLLAKALDDAIGQRAPNPVPVQCGVYLPVGLIECPVVSNGLHPFLANPGDFSKSLGLLFDDPQRIDAECVHNPLCELFPQARHGTAIITT